ncbi:PLP-dependent transferase [Lenzites betulinus]|nr:PLP-dependent transferase [Lenzites betulinus]
MARRAFNPAFVTRLQAHPTARLPLFTRNRPSLRTTQRMSTKIAFRLSDAIQNTGRPPIPQAYEWAESYTPTPSRPLLDMSQGVPGVPPPPAVFAALARAAQDPQNCGYLPNAGLPALCDAIAAEMRVGYGGAARVPVDVNAEDIVVTAGCNLAFVAVAMTLADKGDEVILPVPWYFNHEMTLTMLGITPVLLHTYAREGFLPSIERCAALITEKTKAIVLVTPNNPTGAIYPPSIIAAFARLAHERNIALVLDETYRDFILTHAPHALFSPPTSAPGADVPSADWSWRSTFIHLFSFSKSYCVPGHRLGLVCASPEMTRALCTALDSLQICAPRPPQSALAPLIAGLRPFVRATAEAVAHRHTLFKARLPARWRIGSQGGYYAFVRHPFKGRHANEVCERLAKETGVLSLPAGFFGPKGDEEGTVGDEDRWVRFSVANVDDERVVLVCERLAESENVFGWELD